MNPKTRLTYKESGVDIDKGDELVRRISNPVKQTHRPEVIGGIGGFGGLFSLPRGYQDPVLVAATDGVGTKLKLALEHDAHDHVGIDLVAMCANDLIVQGAEPLFFLDYFSTQHLDLDIAERVVTGIAAGCKEAGAALLGGETAEHPGMGGAAEYDLAGFCVGVVEKSKIIDGANVAAGDIVIGLASSGVHSNGFSLVRQALAQDTQPDRVLANGVTLVDSLMEPTRIYVRSLLSLFATHRPRALAHITGGGLLENIPRVLPENLGVQLDSNSWSPPPIFDWLRAAGISEHEMHRTFNCGIGMVIIVEPDAAAECIKHLEESGEAASAIGIVQTTSDTVRVEIV